MTVHTKWIYIGYLACSLLYFELHSQTLPSPLSTGIWLKFSVSNDGIYKIDYSQLQSADIDPSSINPKYIQLYGNGTGMLPQANNMPRTSSLQELAIAVIGESDEVFNTTDYILFYGQDPDIKQYNSEKKIFSYENHLYSDYNFYFLTIGNTQGKRIANSQNISGTYPAIDTYNDWVYHEMETYNRLSSGRKWFGERFGPSDEVTLSFNIPGMVENTTTQVVSSVMAESSAASSFRISFNGLPVANQSIAPIAVSAFGIKGIQRIDTISIAPSTINTKEGLQQLTYQFISSVSGTSSVGHLDFVLITLERNLALYGSQTLFCSAASLAQSTSTFRVNLFPSNGIIWDVTNPFLCMHQAYTKDLTSAVFSTTTATLKKFIAVDMDKITRPQFEGKVANQNLYINHLVDLLIVVHPLFEKEARRLANHRQSYNGSSVLVATTDEVYNDYSGGKQDPTAIRDFAKDLFKGGLKNILLFGRSSYDFKDRLSQNTNFTPTYASRNSLAPLATYSSDDYFTFFDPLEGEWAENNITIPHTMDIGVGRLPVKTLQEAKIIVDKLIAYDKDPQQMGTWRKEILFVADDGDANRHQQDADVLAENIEENYPDFNTQKIYLDAFEQVNRPSGQVSPAARQALKDALEKGVLIVNFTGHGSRDVWLQERILDEIFIDEWENDVAHPLLLTATCEFGSHDDPHHISSGEKTLTKADGGAIGLITATRLANATSNASLNKAFYDALFKKENEEFRDLGTLFKEMKNNSIDRVGVSSRNFSLLGDPAMQLAIPKKEIVTTYIKTITGSDTLKALSKVIVRGEIRSKGVKTTQFNGTISATLQDKAFLFSTLEDPVDENKIFTYKARKSTLFRGQASITNGAFQFEFIMPENTAYTVGNGKLSLYAVDNTRGYDAIGGRANFKVGEREAGAEEDTTPPTIRLFIGDTTFTDGGITSTNIRVIAILYDQHGINIASQGGENKPIIVLDGTHSFEVGEYYLANKDDFTKGSITFPLEYLSQGNHTIELRVWDVYNNFSSSTLNFSVAQGDGLSIGQLFNYPNPFTWLTRVQFTHNRSGEDLQVTATLVNLAGKLVGTRTYNVLASSHRVVLPEWTAADFMGVELSSGTYLLRLIVRSLEDGAKHEKSIKLAILE